MGSFLLAVTLSYTPPMPLLINCYSIIFTFCFFSLVLLFYLLTFSYFPFSQPYFCYSLCICQFYLFPLRSSFPSLMVYFSLYNILFITSFKLFLFYNPFVILLFILLTINYFFIFTDIIVHCYSSIFAMHWLFSCFAHPFSFSPIISDIFFSSPPFFPFLLSLLSSSLFASFPHLSFLPICAEIKLPQVDQSFNFRWVSPKFGQFY